MQSNDVDFRMDDLHILFDLNERATFLKTKINALLWEMRGCKTIPAYVSTALTNAKKGMETLDEALAALTEYVASLEEHDP